VQVVQLDLEFLGQNIVDVLPFPIIAG
jgi:hypothetical protein